jgi:hypothetical protein
MSGHMSSSVAGGYLSIFNSEPISSHSKTYRCGLAATTTKIAVGYLRYMYTTSYEDIYDIPNPQPLVKDDPESHNFPKN